VTAERILPLEGHELRYRRLGGGYRREDVEQVLAELQHTMRLLEGDLEGLRMRSAELEGEVHDVRAEVEAYRTRESELEQAVQTASAMLERTNRLKTAAFERSRGLVGAVDRLRKDLAQLERAMSELGVSAAETMPADQAAPTGP
jgi:chromosome segregation ATPase